MVLGLKDFKICLHQTEGKKDNLLCECFAQEVREKYLFRLHRNFDNCFNPNHQRFGNQSVWYLSKIPTWTDSCTIPFSQKTNIENLKNICKVFDLKCFCEDSIQSLCKLCHYLTPFDRDEAQLRITKFERWNLSDLQKLFPYFNWEFLTTKTSSTLSNVDDPILFEIFLKSKLFDDDKDDDESIYG